LQKLKGFTVMNASQLLEVVTKVFVICDQKAKHEADRKMKRKVDLLAAALAEESERPWRANPGRGNPQDGDKCPKDAPSLGRN
jgi:hypothetical protein